MNGIFLLPEGLTVAYDGVILKDKETIKRIVSVRNSVVTVFFDSEYANITPSDDCIHVEDRLLSHYLADYRLLKYKNICVHRKRESLSYYL